MNLKVLGLAAGAALFGLQPATASAHADVVVGLEIGIPVASHYYGGYAPTRVYYERRSYPRRDVYWVDHIDDKVNENANEGTDTVIASIAHTLGANVENLTLMGSANLRGTGSSANNGSWPFA